MVHKNSRKNNSKSLLQSSSQSSSRKKLNKHSKRLIRVEFNDDEEINLIDEKAKSLKFKAKICTSSLVVSVLIGLLFVINKQDSIQCTIREVFESELLYVEVMKISSILDWQQEMAEYLMEEQIKTDDLLKQILRPVQERIASLRTQTSQYEKMERIPGGPTSFIDASLQELRHIEDNYLSQVDEQMIELLKEKFRRISEVDDSIIKYMKEAEESTEKIKDYANHILSEIENLDFIGTPFSWEKDVVDNAYVLEDNVLFALEQIFQVLIQLGIKFQDMRDSHDKIKAFSKENKGLNPFANDKDNDDIDPDTREELIERLQEFSDTVETLKSEISENGSLYGYLHFLCMQSFEEVQELRKKFVDYEGDEITVALRHLVHNEVQELLTRIASLRYKSAKVVPKFRIHGFGLTDNILV